VCIFWIYLYNIFALCRFIVGIIYTYHVRFFKSLRKVAYIFKFLIFSSVTTGDDGNEPKEPSNNEQSKYFKFSIFMKYWKKIKHTVDKQIKASPKFHSLN